MVGNGNTCPLEKVLNFARKAHVSAIVRQGPMRSRIPEYTALVSRLRKFYLVDPMRDLLLEYGATDSKELKERYMICKTAYANDPQWLENYWEDPR